MSEHNELEDRAFEALIVSHLIRDRDITNLDDLPALTAAQRAAMEALQKDTAEELWEQSASDADAEEDADCELPVEDDVIEFAGMNRSDGMDDETRIALDEARRNVLDAMKTKHKGDCGAKS